MKVSECVFYTYLVQKWFKVKPLEHRWSQTHIKKLDDSIAVPANGFL